MYTNTQCTQTYTHTHTYTHTYTVASEQSTCWCVVLQIFIILFVFPVVERCTERSQLAPAASNLFELLFSSLYKIRFYPFSCYCICLSFSPLRYCTSLCYSLKSCNVQSYFISCLQNYQPLPSSSRVFPTSLAVHCCRYSRICFFFTSQKHVSCITHIGANSTYTLPVVQKICLKFLPLRCVRIWIDLVVLEL